MTPTSTYSSFLLGAITQVEFYATPKLLNRQSFLGRHTQLGPNVDGEPIPVLFRFVTTCLVNVRCVDAHGEIDSPHSELAKWMAAAQVEDDGSPLQMYASVHLRLLDSSDRR